MQSTFLSSDALGSGGVCRSACPYRGMYVSPVHSIIVFRLLMAMTWVDSDNIAAGLKG